MHILSARRPIECALSPVNDSSGDLEEPIQMTFSHSSKAIIGKMKAFAENQARKTKDIFRMEEEEEIEDEEDIVLDDGEEHPATNRSSNVSMVIDLDEQTSTSEVIVLDYDDNDNDAQSTLGTTAEEDNSDEESEEARRARIKKDIDRILYDQIDAEMDEPIVSILE